jgi:hypothetical protein
MPISWLNCERKHICGGDISAYGLRLVNVRSLFRQSYDFIAICVPVIRNFNEGFVRRDLFLASRYKALLSNIGSLI